MPNFNNSRFGVITRVGLRASPHRRLYGLQVRGAHVDAIAVDYDHARWSVDFLANWPLDSAAWLSYWLRIVAGPRYSLAQALPPANRLPVRGQTAR
jgi:hypothetical protein